MLRTRHIRILFLLTINLVLLFKSSVLFGLDTKRFYVSNSIYDSPQIKLCDSLKVIEFDTVINDIQCNWKIEKTDTLFFGQKLENGGKLDKWITVNENKILSVNSYVNNVLDGFQLLFIYSKEELQGKIEGLSCEGRRVGFWNKFTFKSEKCEWDLVQSIFYNDCDQITLNYPRDKFSISDLVLNLNVSNCPVSIHYSKIGEIDSIVGHRNIQTPKNEEFSKEGQIVNYEKRLQRIDTLVNGTRFFYKIILGGRCISLGEDHLNGARHGKWIYFNLNGKIDKVSEFVNGFKHGPTIVYRYPGNEFNKTKRILKEEKVYIYDKQVGFEVFFKQRFLGKGEPYSLSIHTFGNDRCSTINYGFRTSISIASNNRFENVLLNGCADNLNNISNYGYKVNYNENGEISSYYENPMDRIPIEIIIRD